STAPVQAHTSSAASAQRNRHAQCAMEALLIAANGAVGRGQRAAIGPDYTARFALWRSRPILHGMKTRYYAAAGGLVTREGQLLILHKHAKNEYVLPKGHIEAGESP